MMLSGYLSFYFTDYRETYACSTVGALGGAVFMEAFRFPDIAGIFVIRLGLYSGRRSSRMACQLPYFPVQPGQGHQAALDKNTKPLPNIW